MRKKLILLLLCCFSIAMVACSDDSSDSSNNDVADVADVADTNLGDAQQDTAPDAEEEVEEEDPKLAAGETCPSNCRSLDGGAGSAICNECEDGYCHFPFQDGSDKHCTGTCSNDSNCRSLGDGWKCNTDISLCVFEG